MIERLVKFIAYVNEKIGIICSWFSAALVVVISLEVIFRYCFNLNSVGIQELEWHMFSLLFIGSMAYTLKHDRHVRVDVIYNHLSIKQKAWIDTIGSLVFLIPMSWLIIWTSRDFICNAFQIREGSPNPGGLPTWYLLKALIPIAFGLLLLQTLVLIYQSLSIIFPSRDKS